MIPALGWVPRRVQPQDTLSEQPSPGRLLLLLLLLLLAQRHHRLL